MTEADALMSRFDAVTKRRMQAYCAAYQTDANQVVKAVVTAFLADQAAVLDRLVAGYVEMADLNTAICEEFSASESEAYAYVH